MTPNKPNNKVEEIKSQCCNAEIETDRGGIGVFALTTGAYICSECRKYCVRKQEDYRKVDIVKLVKQFGKKLEDWL